MSKKTDYDIIISGGGCAGLSMAWHLYRFGPADQSILLIEPESESQNDKTWCYWNPKAVPFHHLRKHTWDHINLITDSSDIQCPIHPHPGYHAIDSATYRNWIHQDIANHPYLKVDHGKTRFWKETEDRVIVSTDHGEISGKILFQNHDAGKDLFSESRFGIKQHFVGWEIQVDRPLFNPSQATFMDFRVDQSSGLAFMYMLPWSENNALFEFTLFSVATLTKEDYEEGIKKYLKDHYDLKDDDYRIKRSERGVIPMVENAYSSGTEHVRPIGIVSGAAKPSSGYAFTRIQKQCRFLAESMKQHQPPPHYPASLYRYRAYDIIMLHIIKNRPEVAIKAFEMMFSNLPAPKLLRFLDEETSFREDLAILNSVSKLPFLNATIKELGLLLRGA